jgi:transposase
LKDAGFGLGAGFPRPAPEQLGIVRMRDDDRTKAYAARRTAEGKTRREIIRCIKRYIAREGYTALCATKSTQFPT